MKIRSQAFLFLIVVFITHPSRGCEPTVPQMEAMARRDRAIEEKYVAAIYQRADHVVVGVVVDVRDSKDPSYDQVAEIKVERVLKGQAIQHISALMHKVTKLQDSSGEEPAQITNTTSCDTPYDPTSDEEPYTINGNRALFYIENGILVRVNSFPIEPELMRFHVRKELKFLKDKVQNH